MQPSPMSNLVIVEKLLTENPAEFRTFVEHTENELLALFQSIDRDHNGKLDKGELKEAFRKAGLAVPSSKLDQFFGEVDENHDVRGLLFLLSSWSIADSFLGLHKL